MKLLGLVKLPSALAATSTKTVVTAALLAGVTSAATASVVVIGSNAISPTPRQASSGQPNDGFIVGTKPGTTPLIVVPKSSASPSSKPTESASPSATPSVTSTPSFEAPPPKVVVIDNPSPNPTPAEPSQPTSSPASTSPSPSPSPSPSSTPARPHTPSPSKTPNPSPKPTPTPTQPSCGTFTSAQISWAAHEIGISESSLKSAIKAHPAAICCLPRAGVDCHPANQADLVKLAKQVEALAHKAGPTSRPSSKPSSKGNGDHDGDNRGKGHDKSGCWRAR